VKAPWLAGMLMALLCAPAWGGPEADTKEDPSAPLDPPPVTSPWRAFQFNGTLQQVREHLEALLKEDGLTLKEQNKNTGSFLTDLVEFDEKKFGVDVSTPPPKASPKYPWFQTIEMTSGRFGFEGRLSPLAEGQTRLDLRALLEIRAMDKKLRGMRWVPRYSNGSIEQVYFTRLALSLLQPSPQAQAPSR
jgi:hypothetical protein